jgi:hypothetical protein
MAYTETKAGSGVDKTFDNSFITRNELYAILDQLKEESKFYELEVFEVVEINTTSIGEVIGRYVFSEQGSSVEEVQDRTFLPLNSNIIQYPLRGELWLGMSYKGQQYYLARLSENITDVNFQKFNESTISENQTTDFTRGGDFVDIKPLPATIDEGDTLLQGRFGNYIKLSSRQNEGTEDSPRITINNKKSVIDLESVEDSALIGMSSDSVLISARKNVDIVADGDVFINGNSVTVKNNEAVNIITQQLVTDYSDGVKKDISDKLDDIDSDSKLLPENILPMARAMKEPIAMINNGVISAASKILPPVIGPGIPNPLNLSGHLIDLQFFNDQLKKVKEFFTFEWTDKKEWKTVSLNQLTEALGLNELNSLPAENMLKWDEFFDDIDAAKTKVANIQAQAAATAIAVAGLNAAFDTIQQGGGSTESIIEALDAYEADPSNPPLDTTDIRAVIAGKGVEADDIKRYLDFGGSPQVRELLISSKKTEQDAQKLSSMGIIADLINEGKNL